MAKFPGLIRRGSTYSLRTYVPKDLTAAYGTKEFVTALGTADPAEANKRAKIKAAEFAIEFAAKRTTSVPAEVVEPASLSAGQRRQLADAYFAKRVSDEPYNRRKLLKQARADEASFWAGKIVPAPEDTCTFKGVPYSFWTDICCDGETPLDDAFLYAVDYDHKAKLRRHRKQYDVGDCDAFMEAARELAPHVGEEDCEKLALDLLRAEIRALEAIAARDDARVREITEAVSPAYLVAPPPSGQQVTKSNPPLTVVKDAWLSEKKKKDVRGKTLEAYDEAVSLFIKVVGDKPVGAYSKDAMREFKALLVRLPKHRNKKAETRNLDAHAAADKAHRLGLELLDTRTVNERLATLFNFFNWVGKNYETGTLNPFAGATIETTSDPRDDKDPFTTDDLRKIFDGESFPGRKSADYWVPLLALYTGARANELCKLKSTDVRDEGGVWFLDINTEPFKEAGISPRLKTKNCPRRVPLHADVISFGFVDFATTRRTERLFPELKLTKDGKLQDGFGDKFNRYLKAIGVKRKKIDFHSFRHTWVDACDNAGIPDDTTLRLKGDARPGTLRRYGKGKTELQLLASEVAKLKFKGLDLSHLRVTGPEIGQSPSGDGHLPSDVTQDEVAA